MTSTRLSLPLVRAALWTEQPLSSLEGGSHISAVDVSVGAPDLSAVDPMTRRRLSRLARGMIHAALRVCPEPGDMRTVFASQHGDLERTWALMQELAQGVELSPAHFSVSVHNAVAGLWSMLRQNRGPATAVAAGPETFVLGLMEAYAAWKREPEVPVLYVFGEDRVPEVFRPFTGDLPQLAMAFRIGEPAACRLELDWDPSQRVSDPETPAFLPFLPLLAGCAPRATWQGAQGTWVGHVG